MGDETFEAIETFAIQLSSPVGAVFVDAAPGTVHLILDVNGYFP